MMVADLYGQKVSSELPAYEMNALAGRLRSGQYSPEEKGGLESRLRSMLTTGDRWGSLFGKAESALKQKDYGAALKILEPYRAFAARPIHCGLFNAAHHIYSDIGDLGHYDVVGMCYEKLGDMKKAERSRRLTAQLYEEWGNQYAAAVLYEHVGEYESAHRMYQAVANRGLGNRHAFQDDARRKVNELETMFQEKK